MEFNHEQLYHVYNRGNNKQPIFYSPENYYLFLKKMRTHLLKKARILAYCLMPNHFHWLVYVDKKERELNNAKTLNKNIGTLLSSYTQAINKRYRRTGSLFQQRTKSTGIENREYALTCFHYIHQNPIRANLITRLGQWPYSSYSDYAGTRNGSLIDREFTFRYLELNPKSFVEESKRAINPQKIKNIY